MKTKTHLVECSDLNTARLTDLIDGHILALSIYPFFTIDACKSYLSKLRNNKELKHYSMAQDVDVRRIGMTLFETQNDPLLLKVYFDDGQHTYNRLDELFYPQINPLRYFHESLAKHWPGGGQVGAIGQQKMNPGIIRQFKANADEGLPPHQDKMIKDQSHCSESKELKTQLAANLYLEVPEEGGELEIWDLSFSKEEEVNYYVGQYDFLDRKKIPQPTLRIKPRQGELILFRSDNVHAVRASKKSARTTVSSFIGYYGLDRALRFWA